MKPVLLVLIHLSDNYLAALRQHFVLHYAPTAEARAAAPDHPEAGSIRAVLTNGTVGFSGAELARLPAVELICALGAGYENIDLAAAARRNVAVANGAGTNDDCVADHAFGLLLACVRALRQLDMHCRAGRWRDELPVMPNFSGQRLGILGLGTIGRKIARRGLGFDLDIGYHNRRPRDEVSYTYFDSPVALAQWADYLVVVTPGGAGTRHLVNAEVLRALGPRGFLVNVARGSVVDTAALASALRDGTIAGAGLDVYESEPNPPAELLDLDNVILTPHVGGHSPQAMGATVQRFIDNATRHFAGLPMVSPVPVG
ncbi:2-hydroxyacid dehydrogenase [Bordetella sp. 2513F-2]